MAAVLRLVQLLALLCSLVLAAPTTGPAFPVDDPWYVPPEGFESTAPGTILRSRTPPYPMAAFGVAKVNVAEAHQLLYRTTNSFGDPIATVSTILVPHNADYTKLLSYQVAQDAADPNCAPSYAFQFEAARNGPLGLILPQAELLLMATAMDKGWVVTVPDHLGPKGTFLANTLSGQAVLDNVRAALSSSDLTKISPDSTVSLWGYSGGSLASGFAAELQSSYAPELKIAGAALGGTVPKIPPVIEAVNQGIFTGLIPAGVQGLSNEYPSIAKIIDENIIEDKKPAFSDTKNLCLPANIVEYLGQDIYTYTKNPDIFTAPEVTKILDANAMGHHIPEIPLIVYKSANDEVSPVNATDELVTSYCDAGADVEYKRDFLSEHGSLVITGVPDAMIWLNDRMNGVPVEKGCSRETDLTGLEDPKALAVLGTDIVEILLHLLSAPVGPIMIG